MRDQERRELARRLEADPSDELAAERLRRAEERSAPPAPPHGQLHGVVLFIGQRGSEKTLGLLAAAKRNREARFVVPDRLGYWKNVRGRVWRLPRATPEEGARFAIQKVPFSTLVLDEVGEAFPPDWDPHDKDTEALSEIVRVGRQPCAEPPWTRPGPVALLGATQQPFLVSPRLRGFVSRYYLGRIENKRDAKWVEQATNSEWVAWRVRRIPLGRFIVVDTS